MSLVEGSLQSFNLIGGLFVCFATVAIMPYA
jgi:hypothetical protein